MCARCFEPASSYNTPQLHLHAIVPANPETMWIFHCMGKPFLSMPVTLTDVPRVMPLLARNAALASVPDVSKVNGVAPAVPPMPNIQVRSLLWGEAEAKKFLEQHGPFDLILCCEVVYQLPQKVWEALQQTLRQLLVPGGRVVFAYQHRDGAEAIGGRACRTVTDAVFFQTLEQAANLRFDQEDLRQQLQSRGGFQS
eukprot:s1200_g31.t1